MSNAPVYDIDLQTFWHDPYPDLKAMRQKAPIAYVPQLGATLLTRRNDIFENEKIIDVFSSDQPDGLMTKLMGRNMMRKDGPEHLAERKAIFPTISPKTVKTIWKQSYERMVADILDDIAPLGQADMVNDIAMRISGEALKIITGLTSMAWQEMDQASQGLIDGIANYQGDPEIEARCHASNRIIEHHINRMLPVLEARPDTSLLAVHMQADLPLEQAYANVKLAISGGQNEVRDVLAGLIWALLRHPEQFDLIQTGVHTWMDAFEEFVRWISPIGMSPRRIACQYTLHDVTLEPEDRVFLMFGSGNRDETVFDYPDEFRLSQDKTRSIPFGAGPHFCAGAWASRCLIAEVAVPMIFSRLKNLQLAGEAPFGGRAFRGPLKMPIIWQRS